MAAKKGGSSKPSKPKGFKGAAGAHVAHIASRAGQTKNEGFGVVKLARQVARGGAGANAARKTIYAEGRTVRKESGKAAAFAYNKAIAQVERNTRLNQQARHPIERTADVHMRNWNKANGTKGQ